LLPVISLWLALTVLYLDGFGILANIGLSRIGITMRALLPCLRRIWTPIIITFETEVCVVFNILETKVCIVFNILKTRDHVIAYIVVIVSPIGVFIWSAIAEIAFGLVIIIILDVGGGMTCTVLKIFILVTGS